jgi:hypothetical protein
MIASGLDFSESRLEPLTGSGPYIVGEIDPGRSTVFVRNPDYWGNDLPINQGRHNFESIRIEYYADAIAAFEGFTAGNYLFRQENSSQNWANNYDFPRLNDGIVIREEIPQGLIASGQSFVFNLRREKFQDPRVREAIALMFNFEWTNQTLFYGLYSPIDSFWENTHLEAEGMAPPEELAVLEPFRDRLPEEIFTDVPFATPTSDPDRTFDRRQARRATALLEEAGWTPGDDGMLRNAAGETLEVEFLNAGPLFDRIINPYVENLRAIGIDASLNRVDGAQMSQRQRDADFDIITDHFPMGYEPGTEPAAVFRHDRRGRVAVQRGGPGRSGDRRIAGDGDPRRNARRDGDRHACARPGVCAPIASACRNGSTTAPGSRITTTTAIRRNCRPMASDSSISGGSIRRPSRRCAIRACSDPDGRLYPQTPAAHDPDAVRDHGRELRPDPVRAGRSCRTGAAHSSRGRATSSPGSPAAATRAAWRVGDRGQLSGRAGPAAAVPR